MEIANDQQQLQGIRFDPTDGELIVHFLKKYIMKASMPYNKIEEVDVYAHCPQILTEKHHPLGEKKWYFFTPRNPRYQNGIRPSRLTGDGFWKATGGHKAVSHNGQTVGFKMTLVFNEGKPGKGEKTNWIMHEYKVKGHDDAKFDGLVLCRIYKRNVKSSKNKQEPAADSTPSQILSSAQPDSSMFDAALNWNDMSWLDIINFSESDTLIRSDRTMDSSLTSTLPSSSIINYHCPMDAAGAGAGAGAGAANNTEFQVMFNQSQAVVQPDVVTPPQIRYSHPMYPARFGIEEEDVVTENDWNCSKQNCDWNCGVQNYDHDLLTTSITPYDDQSSESHDLELTNSILMNNTPYSSLPLPCADNNIPCQILSSAQPGGLMIDNVEGIVMESRPPAVIPPLESTPLVLINPPPVVNIEEEAPENILDDDLEDVISAWKPLEDDHDFARILDSVPLPENILDDDLEDIISSFS